MSTIVFLFDLLLKTAGLGFAGFFVFSLLFGIGISAALAFHSLPWWGVVLGSVGGVIILATMAERKGGGKK